MQTRRAQVLMEPEEYERLEAIARQNQTSVGALFRDAVRRCYLAPPPDRLALVDELAAMNLDIPEWAQLEFELGAVHDAGIP